MAISSFSAAKLICEQGSWRVTNLVLQKVLYINQMLFMGKNNGERLVDASFEAWDYGPVEPNLYRKVCLFGNKPIQDIFFVATPPVTSPEFIAIQEGCRFLLNRKPGELVALTHWEQGAWARNYVAGHKGTPIPDDHIIAEYRARIAS